MIRFSARSVICCWCLKGGRLFGTGRLFLFWETTKCWKKKKKNFNIYLKTNSNRKCNSNKYCTDGEYSVNVRDLPLSWYQTCWACADGTSFLIFTFLKKARSDNKMQVKETGRRTCCPWILPRQNDQPSNRRKIWRKDFSFEEFMHSHGHKTTVFVMWHYRLFVSN